MVATDPDGDVLTFAATNLPPGLTIDAATGLISGTVAYTAAAGGPYATTVTVTDTTGASVSSSCLWTVTDTNRPPAFDHPGNDRTDAEGDLFALPVVATDPDGDVLTFAATNLPPGLAIDAATGLISGTVAYTAADGGPYATSVTVTDAAAASVSSSCLWTITDTNRAPSITNPGALAYAEGDTVGLQLIGSDPDGDSLVFAALSLPAGVVLDPATGLLTGVLASGTEGSFAITVSIADDLGASHTTTFDWLVAASSSAPVTSDPSSEPLPEPVETSEQGGAPPTDPASGDEALASGNDSEAPTVTDPADSPLPPDPTEAGAILAFGPPQAQPDGSGLQPSAGQESASSVGTAGATTSVQPDATEGQSQTHETATESSTADPQPAPDANTVEPDAEYPADDNEPTDEQSTDEEPAAATIEVVNPGDQINAVGDTVELRVTVPGSDDNTLTYSVEGLPPGLSLDSATGIVSGELLPTAVTDSPYTITVSVVDDSGATGTAVFDWTVAAASPTP